MLEEYSKFVDGVTSPASKDMVELLEHLIELQDETSTNIPRLMTAGIGMVAEAGEFADIVKKLTFHGKMMDEATHDHLVKELGDTFWYWTQACLAIGVEPEVVIYKNQEKLMSRYTDSTFSKSESETRKEGDI